MGRIRTGSSASITYHQLLTPCRIIITVDGDMKEFHSGAASFASSPATGFEENVENWNWLPARLNDEPQIGIPNRYHGSDHLPVVCTLRFQEKQLLPVESEAKPSTAKKRKIQSAKKKEEDVINIVRTLLVWD